MGREDGEQCMCPSGMFKMISTFTSLENFPIAVFFLEFQENKSKIYFLGGKNTFVWVKRRMAGIAEVLVQHQESPTSAFLILRRRNQ